MRKTKKLAALMLAGAMAASLAACGGQTASTDTTAAESADGEESKEGEQTADGETYKIGVLQLTQHVALDKTNEGFVAALDDAGIKYEIDQQNAAGEQSACQTIAEKLVNDKDDLIEGSITCCNAHNFEVFVTGKVQQKSIGNNRE